MRLPTWIPADTKTVWPAILSLEARKLTRSYSRKIQVGKMYKFSTVLVSLIWAVALSVGDETEHSYHPQQTLGKIS